MARQMRTRDVRYLFALLASFGLASCDALTSNEEHAFQVCEGYIAQGLRSPSTYNRVSAIAEPAEPGQTLRTVYVEYDAANAYGTAIRGAEGCIFNVAADTGEFPNRNALELGALEASAERSKKRLAELKGERKPDGLDGFIACCVSGEDRDRAIKSIRKTGGKSSPGEVKDGPP